MNRIREYAGFAVGYTGLGYMVLWPLSAAGQNGQPFGASLMCGDTSWLLLDFICHSEHRLQMPASLHALGLMSASIVVLRLFLYAFKRSRRAAATPRVDISTLLARLPDTSPVPRSRKPQEARQEMRQEARHVRPRTQFGLRGLPH